MLVAALSRGGRPTMALEGVLIIDKPAGLVSMRVVEQVRRLTRTKRAGHAGTLDPAATGVLPLCLGQATRVAALLLGEDKEYLATVRLGLETESGDLDGAVLRTSPVPERLGPAELAPLLAALTGTITQRPPAFSAIRVDGERLYDRARRGEEALAPERQVAVHELELLGVALPDLELRVRCGKGTYVRSLATDLGAALGCGATLAALRRTRVGSLGLDRAVTLEEVAERARAGRLEEVLLSAAEALAHLPAVTIDEAACARVRQGQPLRPEQLGLPVEALPPPGATVRLLDARGALVALAEREADRLQPHRVFER